MKPSPRVATAQRNQIEMRAYDLESTLSADHVARAIWAVVMRLDLSAFYGEIKARGSEPGRSATDPKILLTLWLYATTQGVGSGREVARLCGSDDAYRWICGGVSVNYHTLNDFRVEHGDKLDNLLVQVIGAMSHQGLVKLERVAQDGMRVRADAGAASFRREETLREHQVRAREQVTRLRKELAEDPAAYQRVRQAAEMRAAEMRAAAIDRALAEMPAVIEVKKRSRSGKTKSGKKSEPRVSTTDPEARVMKMADGGFRPAYNVQLATDTESRVVVGVGLSNRGSDMSLMMPMLDDIVRRTGRQPGEHLVDGGFVNLDAIAQATQRGITVYAPEMRPRTIKVRKSRRVDSAEVAQWRSRMKRSDSQEIYRWRAATAETVNADLRAWRSLDRIPVRGLAKARCHVLLNVITYNLGRWRTLAAA